MVVNTPSPWLVHHPYFEELASESCYPRLWSFLAEGFAPLIYSVPTFLGITLARSDEESRPLLASIWKDELGVGETPSHPVLFESFHRYATSLWGHQPEMHLVGARAAKAMIDLCTVGSWPIGVAAMAAHESQFPLAYSALLPNADLALKGVSEFFKVHSTADVEHSSAAVNLLKKAIQNSVIDESAIEGSFVTSGNILRSLFDDLWKAVVAGEVKSEQLTQ